MKVSVLNHNKETRIILIPENQLDIEVLKQSEGGTLQKVSDGVALLETNLCDAAMITISKTEINGKDNKNEETKADSDNSPRLPFGDAHDK